MLAGVVHTWKHLLTPNIIKPAARIGRRVPVDLRSRTWLSAKRGHVRSAVTRLCGMAPIDEPTRKCKTERAIGMTPLQCAVSHCFKDGREQTLVCKGAVVVVHPLHKGHHLHFLLFLALIHALEQFYQI